MQANPPKTQKSANGAVLANWAPENETFWRTQGERTARRNLWISIPCLLLSFCVWMIFSSVAVNLNRAGFHFTTDQLFLLTALPSVSGALARVPYSFVVPLIGGRRWTAISTFILAIPCLWLGYAVQHPETSFQTFIIIALLCGLAGGNFASSMANISFFYPKAQQGKALGLNGGLGNLGVSVMQLVVPLVISVAVFGSFTQATPLADGGSLWLANAAWIWVPFILLATIAAWIGMNDLHSAKASIVEQLPVLRQPHLWILSILYLATFGSFIGFSAGFAMLTKTQFPDIAVMHYAFFGPLIGALARPIGGSLSDKLGGIKVTTVNFIAMALFTGLVFFALPGGNTHGSFWLFFAVFMCLFITAGLGSGSTFQMISVIFRRVVMQHALNKGLPEEDATRRAGTDTAAALGFISAIGAAGGFFIPRAFGLSLSWTGSPLGALKVFLVFYVVCIVITWCVYGRRINQGMATRQKA
ncbi:nitrate/nitrite transporter [Mangrovibacter phragmitis]|uniref:Nitrate/nitrite transporter n=1 Tax=Mangrovibacter phragmitis TaxID=1691903 RepID=A0A1B7L941_9ENTR|nr:NarK family nitrate/nitrite MFS transporter [Mangrovibacter phragmitis]OAT78869.1 nitrate/nitrite transporter [Mangrovibacter phragmitis]